MSLSETLPIHPAVAGFAAALAVGLVVGLERGWREREQAEGSRVAGLRTFALIGLFGGVAGALADRFGAWAFVAGLLALGLLGAVSYRESVRSSGSLSATSSIAALLTYALGALATTEAPAFALGLAVVAAVLLDMKPTLHRWLQLIEHRELSAALQMLVLSAVVLPLLPDRGYGPYEVLNPYRLWWAVVLVAGLSMAGHVAMRITGAQRGSLWTGVLGGLASSTAATLALSRRVRAEPRLLDAGAAGILAACGVMFLRMTVIVAVLQPALARSLAVPLVAAGVALLVIAAWQWRQRERAVAESAMQDAAPFDLSMALGFAAFLGLMAVLVRAAGDWLGAPGLYGLAALSGLADVDAILISTVRMNAAGALPLIATAWVAGIAAATNMVTKAVMAWLAGSVPLGRRVALGYLVALAVGALAGAAWIA
ncbi:MAG: MgtC/SapB family protein [Caldimonas sp.]